MKTATLGRPIVIGDRITKKLDDLTSDSDLHFELVLSPGSAVLPEGDADKEELAEDEGKGENTASSTNDEIASGNSPVSMTFTRHTYESLRENDPSASSSSNKAVGFRFDRRGVWEDLIKVILF